jgi:hypothetical protein
MAENKQVQPTDSSEAALAKAKGLLKTHTNSEITRISGFLNFE